MTAAYMLEPEFCRHDFDDSLMDLTEDGGEDGGNTAPITDLHACMKRCATAEHPFGDLVAEYAKFTGYLQSKTHNFDDEGAFSKVNKELPAHQ